MNKELLTKFQLQAGGSHYPGINPQIQEIFARLIVQECIDCIRGAGLTDEVAVRNGLGFNDGLAEAVINVQKHFGVKE